MFPWAKFRRRKAVATLHALLDLRGNLPVLIHITHDRIHAINLLDELFIEA
jgi:hypothetical protein